MRGSPILRGLLLARLIRPYNPTISINQFYFNTVSNLIFTFTYHQTMEEIIKGDIVTRLQAVKHNSGKSYNQLAEETGLTNVYVAQLLRRQAQLKPDTATKLWAALPELPEELVQEMMRPPLRSYDPNLIQEPTVYRLNEAVMHFGESIKEVINEEFGDGIMSAIDFYCSVDKVKGVDGKDRVVLTFDGKYLPYTEQKSEHMVSRTRLQGNQ